MFILETDRIHTQNLHSVSNRRLFRQWFIVHLSLNETLSQDFLRIGFVRFLNAFLCPADVKSL